MPLKIAFEIDSTHYESVESIEDEHVRGVMSTLRDEITRELADVKCPEHGEHPTLIVSPHDDDFAITVEPCCDLLADLVAQKFALEADWEDE